VLLCENCVSENIGIGNSRTLLKNKLTQIHRKSEDKEKKMNEWMQKKKKNTPYFVKNSRICCHFYTEFYPYFYFIFCYLIFNFIF